MFAAAKECSEDCEKEKEIRKYKNLRRGKKSSITKRIAEIRQIISENGSRTKVLGLLNLLFKVHENAKKDNEKVTELTEHALEDAEWIDDIDLAVDNCKVDVEAYLESRKDDAPSSSASRTREWVEKTRAVETENGTSDSNSEISPLTSTILQMPVSNAAAVMQTSTPVDDPVRHNPSSTYDQYTPVSQTHGRRKFCVGTGTNQRSLCGDD